MGNFLSSYFKNSGYSAISQAIVGFALGILFAPYSWGFIFYVGFIIVSEIFTYAFTRGDSTYYGDLRSRLLVVMASISGFILGRFLYTFGNVLV
jgi:hypothetical protein